MKYAIAAALSLFSFKSYSIGYDCNLLVNGDFKNSKSFSFDGSLPVDEENGLYKAELTIQNIGSPDRPDNKLRINLFRGVDYSMALFEPNAEHPFVSSRVGLDFAQVQCWSKSEK